MASRTLWRNTVRRLICNLPLLLISLSVLSLHGHVRAQAAEAACGDPFHNHFGPFDYRAAPKETRKLVEDYHFTPGIETMTQPKNTMMHDMAQDVSYTLQVFPNHPRALITMMRLAEKYKVDPPPGTGRSVECWFDRAVRFRPDDTVARILYAKFLAKKLRTEDALHQLDMATRQAADNPLSHYNIGLVYFEMQQYDRALEQAHKAMKLGMNRAELIDRLKRVNKWTEPSGS